MKKPARRIKGYDQGGTIDPGPSVGDRVMAAVRGGATLARIGQLYGQGGSGTSSPKSPTEGTDLGGLYKGGGRITRVAGKPVGRDDGLIAASKGEYVIKKSAAKKLGTGVLNTINKGKLPKARGR